MEYAGYGAGKAEFAVYGLSGKLMASKRIELSENGGSVVWSQLDGLPKGVYNTKVVVGSETQNGSRFIKY